MNFYRVQDATKGSRGKGDDFLDMRMPPRMRLIASGRILGQLLLVSGRQLSVIESQEFGRQLQPFEGTSPPKNIF